MELIRNMFGLTVAEKLRSLYKTCVDSGTSVHSPLKILGVNLSGPGDLNCLRLISVDLENDRICQSLVTVTKDTVVICQDGHGRQGHTYVRHEHNRRQDGLTKILMTEFPGHVWSGVKGIYDGLKKNIPDCTDNFDHDLSVDRMISQCRGPVDLVSQYFPVDPDTWIIP